MGVANVVESHEVVRVELVVPLRFIKGAVHVESIMVDALVVPLAILVEQEHLLRVRVGINHVQVEALMLLEEWTPRGSAPVVVLGDGNDLVDRHIRRLHAVKL